MYTGVAGFLTRFFLFFIKRNKFSDRTDIYILFDRLFENKGFLRFAMLFYGFQIIFAYFFGEILRTVGLTLLKWIYAALFYITIILLDLARTLTKNAFGVIRSEYKLSEYLLFNN